MSARVVVPSPESIRWSSARKSAAPPRRVPFGLSAWSDGDASAVSALAITLDVTESWPISGIGDVPSIAAQLPRAESLASGTLVVLLAEAAHDQGFLGKLLMRRAPSIARATRGSALLACGYTSLGGGVDPASGLDLAWAYAPG